MEFKEIVVLDDRFEADIVEQALRDADIPYYIRQYGNDGIDIAFRLSRGWGVVSVDERYLDKAFTVVREALESQPEVPLDKDGNPIFPSGGGGGSALDL